ncbi:MAG: bifunctional phosphopantothenoylcysteine decarboxylase/phosphopantothenate--cysteine ligase CoaBC [Solirubrobacteraceae bacterium]
MPRILLGVSGGIAAYKALELIRLATAGGHSVRVVQTPTSQRFVGEASFAALSGAPVLTDEFEHDPARGAFPGQELPTHQPLSHLQLVANADLYLIAPASANTLAKLAAGLADNLLMSCALAATCPVVVAPAMNNHMYEHAATKANLELLQARGVHIVQPGFGRLASIGEHGVGRLAEPEQLLATCEEILAGGAALTGARSHIKESSPSGVNWNGLRVLVTAGGTREPIDSVRFVGNSSSGRMGLALAQAARLRGAEVTLVAANVGLEPPHGIAVRRVSTAAELQATCEQEFPSCDVLLMAAAVADFRPLGPVDGKIKKGGRQHLTIELESTADVLCELSSRREPGQTLIAFAAEHGPEAQEHARSKLAAKGVDAVVFNDISRADIGFESDSNEVTIITADGDEQVPRAPKQSIASAILDVVARLREETA